MFNDAFYGCGTVRRLNSPQLPMQSPYYSESLREECAVVGDRRRFNDEGSPDRSSGLARHQSAKSKPGLTTQETSV